MGTFILRPTSVSANLNWITVINFVLNDPSTDPQLIEAITSEDYNATYMSHEISGGPAENASISFGCLGLSLYLDGSPIPTDTNNLPVGFTVTAAALMARGAVNPGNPGMPGSVTFLRDGSTIATIDETDPIPTEIDADLGLLSNLSLISSILGVNSSLPDASVETYAQNLRIEGTYSIQSFTITLTPSGGDVEPGQTIDVDGDPTNFTYAGTSNPKVIPIPKKPGEDPKLPVPLPPTEECSECLEDCPECDTCYDACSEDLESENCQECLDTCLDCLADCLEDEEEAEKCQQSTQGDPPTDIVIIVCDPRGTRFTGSVPAGNFTILVARASGIYRLEHGKANDTLYATARDGTTYDVAIPTPFAKTGFMRS